MSLQCDHEYHIGDEMFHSIGDYINSTAEKVRDGSVAFLNEHMELIRKQTATYFQGEMDIDAYLMKLCRYGNCGDALALWLIGKQQHLHFGVLTEGGEWLTSVGLDFEECSMLFALTSTGRLRQITKIVTSTKRRSSSGGGRARDRKVKGRKQKRISGELCSSESRYVSIAAELMGQVHDKFEDFVEVKVESPKVKALKKWNKQMGPDMKTILDTCISSHPPLRPRSCVTCTDTLDTYEQLWRHVEKEHKDVHFACATCAKEFATMAACTQHSKCHNPKAKTSHTTSNSSSTTVTTDKISGDIIPVTRMSARLKDQQFKATHSDVANSQSDSPSKATSTTAATPKSSKKGQDSSAQPSTSHGGGGASDLKCSLCGKVFEFPSYLQAHLRSHSFAKPHKCTFEGCEREYKSVSQLNMHMKSHSDKLYTCAVKDCDFTTLHFNDFRYHKNEKHASDDRYQCDLCDFVCKHRGSMSFHKKNSH